jgi:sucrose-6-phosphate hydrolase SacC (GH32 family)
LFIRDDDGGLGSRPIAELDSLASGNAIDLGAQNVQETLSIGNSSTGRLQLSVDLSSTTASSFTVNVLSSSAEATLITYTVATNTLTVDSTQAGYGPQGTWSATLAIASDNVLSLDVLLDHTILEVFSSDGTAITASTYPRYAESAGIVLVANEGSVAATSITLTPYGSSWS